MLYNQETAREIANGLLGIRAVVLNTSNPFTWASGLKSPVYCDNRKTLAHPKLRTIIKSSFVELISDRFPDVNLVAGVATGAIAQGAMIADALDLPYVYVRDKPKSHGMGNLIEGEIRGGEKVVVVEDLISTGGSSLKAVDALRAAQVDVLGLVAIFSYGFSEADQRMQRAGVAYYTLSDYPTLIEQALAKDYVPASDKPSLLRWYQNPTAWVNS